MSAKFYLSRPRAVNPRRLRNARVVAEFVRWRSYFTIDRGFYREIEAAAGLPWHAVDAAIDDLHALGRLNIRCTGPTTRLWWIGGGE